MILTTPTHLRQEIISQFPIPDRDTYVYKSIEEAVEDALRRAFKDINFRTMTATAANNSIVKILGQINGSKKIKKFDIATVKDQEEKAVINRLIKRLNNNVLAYDNCKITEYLIVYLVHNGFVDRFVDYFNCHTYKVEPDFDKWHHTSADMFLTVLQKYYAKANYGKAQKIINMMFKHLYCMNFGGKNAWQVLDEGYFQYCHMPLDSFTLDWLYRRDGIAICEWSNLEYVSVTGSTKKASTFYNDYVIRVRKQFPLLGLSAFQGEFYIWPQMQITQALETIYRLNHSKSTVTTFIGFPITKKCSEMVLEIAGMSFSKTFI